MLRDQNIRCPPPLPESAQRSYVLCFVSVEIFNRPVLCRINPIHYLRNFVLYLFIKWKIANSSNHFTLHTVTSCNDGKWLNYLKDYPTLQDCKQNTKPDFTFLWSAGEFLPVTYEIVDNYALVCHDWKWERETCNCAVFLIALRSSRARCLTSNSCCLPISDTSAPRQSNSALSNGGQCQPIDSLQSAVSHCQFRLLSSDLYCMMQVRYVVALDQSGNNQHILLPLTVQLCSRLWKVLWSRKLVWLFRGVGFVTTAQVFL